MTYYDYAVKRCTTSEIQQSTTLGMRHVQDAFETLKLTSVLLRLRAIRFLADAGARNRVRSTKYVMM